MVQPTSLVLFLLLTLHLSVSGVISVTFTLVNQCNYTVWPASLTTSGNSTLVTTGFVLKSGESSTVTSPATWNGHFWGRTDCTTDSATGNFSCGTGDCGTGKVTCGGKEAVPPVTVAEFRLSGNGGHDYYNVNLVDGYNVPMVVLAVGGSKESCNNTGSKGRNNTFTCSSADYNITFCSPSFEARLSLGSLDQGLRVGDSLTTDNGTTKWLSPSGDFAFGFYPLSNKLFLLAIWYEKGPNGGIIWYANNNNPAPKGSTLELNDSHGIVLRNPQGSELWKTNFESGTIFGGRMNDTGNFQLWGKNNETLWESFQHPTDTLVPTQEMKLNDFIFSRQGEFNFSRGRFKIHLQNDGNLVFKLQDSIYYDTETADSNDKENVGDRLIFEKSGFLYILKKNGQNFSLNDEKISNEGFYYKATINYDGVFIISYYPKDPIKSQNWNVDKTLPENICLFSKPTNPEGMCGFNSICTLNNDKRPICACPEGYSSVDSNNMYGGCKRVFQACEGGNQGSQDDLYTMKELPHTDWPRENYISSPLSLQDCKESCLKDCSCMSVFFNESSCLKKNLPLYFGRTDFGVKGSSYMKLRTNNSLISSNEKKDHDSLITLMAVLLGCFAFIILTLVGTIYFLVSYKHKKIENRRTNKSFVDENLRNFTFEEIVEATNNFEEELGRGSCGIVYKGIIEMSSVAVKKLDKLFQDSDKEFKTEMNAIGQTHHRNLVRLLGYCNEGQHRILVYELMSNGTLASFLFNSLKPNWNKRVHIVLGIARGLVYLHEGCSTQIIHCDIKPQNILLDDYYNAKISDFGLAKLLLFNQSRTETGIRGTKGYVAPDWFRSAPITAKVDTYSFGVLLLEIICCRKNVEKDIVDEEKEILTDWTYDCYKNGRLDNLLENDCEAIHDLKSLEKYVMIAMWCIQEDPSLRPAMKEVLLMLEGTVEVAVPPSPYLSVYVGCNSN